jgi:hypothetical protein
MKPKHIIALAVIALGVIGCQTITDFATPNRVEAISALGAYLGGEAAIDNGHRADLVRALAGLEALKASGKADLPAIAEALRSADVAVQNSSEGAIAFSTGAILFSDLWAGSGQVELDDVRAKAALDGVIRGFRLALGPSPKAVGQSKLDSVVERCVATRPRI